MKKLIALLLTLTLLCTLAACGQKEEADSASEGITAIPLGGDLGAFDTTDPAYGEYIKIDLPADLADFVPDESAVDCYYCEESKSPYILVFRFSKDGQTLEECADSIMENAGSPGWETLDEDGRHAILFQCNHSFSDGSYYYVDCTLMEDGDEFVEMDILKKCEEVQLGDTDQYLWIPAGYTDNMDEDSAAHDVVFRGSYDAEYYLPGIWISKDFTDYEGFCWYWGQDWDEIPVDEATYNAWVKANWDYASLKEYYAAFGITNLTFREGEYNACNTFVATGDYGGRMEDIYIEVGESSYNVFLYSELEPAPDYSEVLLNSLHSGSTRGKNE